MSYCFRIRFEIPKGTALDIDSERYDLPPDGTEGLHVVLSSKQGDTIRNSQQLKLLGEGCLSESQAQECGEQYRDAISLAFAHFRIGADFGDRRSERTVLADTYREKMEKDTGAPLLNDAYGLLTFRNQAGLLFVEAIGEGIAIRNMTELPQVLSYILENQVRLTPKDRLAYDLFSAYRFQRGVDARFLMLMMAVEALIEPLPRSHQAQEHVDQLINMTKGSCNLTTSEKESMVGSLGGLRKESISQAGQRLARNLRPNTYMGLGAPEFFKHCYDLRSKLVHGEVPRPSVDDLRKATGPLETFVLDLICKPLAPMLSK